MDYLNYYHEFNQMEYNGDGNYTSDSSVEIDYPDEESESDSGSSYYDNSFDEMLSNELIEYYDLESLFYTDRRLSIVLEYLSDRFFISMQKGYMDDIEYLLNHYILDNLCHYNVFNFSVQYCDPIIVDVLLDYNCNFISNIKVELHDYDYKRHFDILKVLLKHNKGGKHIPSIIDYLIEDNPKEIVKFLIENKLCKGLYNDKTKTIIKNIWYNVYKWVLYKNFGDVGYIIIDYVSIY